MRPYVGGAEAQLTPVTRQWGRNHGQLSQQTVVYYSPPASLHTKSHRKQYEDTADQ